MPTSATSACATIAAALFVLPASAVDTYTSLAGWTAALGGAPIATETFDDAEPQSLAGGGPFVFPTLSLTAANDDTTYIEPGSGTNNINGTTYIDAFVAPALDSPFGSFPEETLTITFFTPTTAFGFDYRDAFIATASAGIDIYIDNVLITNTRTGLGFSGSANSFIGFISADAFTTVTFRTPVGVEGLEIFGIDNVRSVVPAPSAAGVLAFGALAASRRRR